MDALTLDEPPPDHTLLLPPELLLLIAELIPTPPTLASHLARGVLQGTFETQKLGTAEAFARPSRPVSVPRSGANDLGAMRLVCRRWEEAARPVAFRRAKVKRVEELEFWLGEGVRKGGKRLTACVQRLDLLIQPCVEKASYDDNLPEPALVLEALIKAMPALSKLSIQAPLPLTLLETLLLPDIEVFNRIELLVDISLVIQTTRWDDPDFASALSRHSRTLPVPVIVPFLTLHPHLRTLHLGGCHLGPPDVQALLAGLAAQGIRLETFSVELVHVEGQELEDRREVLRITGEEMGDSLLMLRFAGAVEMRTVPVVTLSKEDEKALPTLLRSHKRLQGIRLGLRATNVVTRTQSFHHLASLLGRGCSTLRNGDEAAIVWEETSEIGQVHEAGWNPDDNLE